MIPDPFDRRVAPTVAKAVASTAISTGVAGICLSDEELNDIYEKRLFDIS